MGYHKNDIISMKQNPPNFFYATVSSYKDADKCLQKCAGFGI